MINGVWFLKEAKSNAQIRRSKLGQNCDCAGGTFFVHLVAVLLTLVLPCLVWSLAQYSGDPWLDICRYLFHGIGSVGLDLPGEAAAACSDGGRLHHAFVRLVHTGSPLPRLFSLATLSPINPFSGNAQIGETLVTSWR